MSWIEVDPYRRPRLSKSGLLTIMSASGRGLACVAGVCPTPGCGCRDILMNVVPIDFRVKKVSVSGDNVKFATVPVGGLGPAEDMRAAVNARLITDTGELLVEPKSPGQWESPVDPREDALLEPLRQVLDGELLDDFARFCMRIKGEVLNFDDPIPDLNIGDWQPGDRLGFSEVYNTVRVDGFREGDTIWEVADFYCPDPRCDCGDVEVAFLDRDSRDASAGSLTLTIATGEVSFAHETDDETLVPKLWRRFVERHRGVSNVHARLGKMKTFGSTLIRKTHQVRTPERSASPVRKPGHEVGRNGPCPCGSGKKYKKCCLSGTS